MKLDRNIFEKLIETNTEAYALLHYQYTILDTRYNKLDNEYRETVRRIEESGLIDPKVFNEVKSAYSQAALLLAEAQQELNELSGVRDENTRLKTRLHDLKRDRDNIVECYEAAVHDIQVSNERIRELQNELTDLKQSSL